MGRNVGVRYVRTEETGRGFAGLTYLNATGASTSVTNPFDGGRKYQRVLPSLNLRLHITPTLQARFAFSQNLFRPTFTFTLFDKKLKDIIDSRSFLTSQDVPTVGVVQFNVNSVTNVTDGYVRGFEVGGQTFFNFLAGPFAGLGVAANYTLADSNAGTVASGSIGAQTQVAVPLINLSRNSYNLMALYDYAGWNIRVAYNWRDKYLDSISETGAETLPIYFTC